MRVTSSQFSAPALGQVFTFTSPCASAWAVAGLRLFFPAYGWATVLVANNDSVSAQNDSINPNTGVGIGVGFHVSPPDDGSLQQSLSDEFCTDTPDADLPVAENHLGCVGGIVTMSRPKLFPDEALVRFEYDGAAVIDIFETAFDGSQPNPHSGTIAKPAAIPSEATHLILRGSMQLDMGSGAGDMKLRLEFGTSAGAEVAYIDINNPEVMEGSTAFGDNTIKMDISDNIAWKTVRQAGANDGPEMSLRVFIVGWSAPASAVIS